MECGMEWKMEWNRMDGMEPTMNKINLNIFIQHFQVDWFFVSGIHSWDLVKQLQLLCTNKLIYYTVVSFNIATYVYKSLEVVPTNNSLPKVFTPTKKLLLSLDEEPINLEYGLMTILM